MLAIYLPEEFQFVFLPNTQENRNLLRKALSEVGTNSPTEDFPYTAKMEEKLKNVKRHSIETMYSCTTVAVLTQEW
jgi:hypothetical protein